jgi:signal transduction histidine kinase
MTGVPVVPDTRLGGTHGRISTPGDWQAGVFALIPCPLLRAAAERVAAGWPDEPTDTLVEASSRDAVVVLARAVFDRRSGRTPVLPPAAATPLSLQVLERLRIEILNGGGSPGDPTLAVATLRALEAVRVSLPPTAIGDSAAKLSSAEALEVLVEVAHDLRSPLTSILFLAETLQRGQSGPINDLQHRQLGLVYGAAFGLSTLASDLIELARGGSRLVERQPTPLSINEVFHSVRDIVRPLAEEKRLAVMLSPPTPDHRMGHSLALSRVLLNLTTNALKFTEEGHVELSGRATGDSVVEFSVRDTGRGMGPDALASVFTAFRRAPRRMGFAFSGTGLGLTICRRLVTAMDSELKVESTVGTGTRFFFELHMPAVSAL